MTDSHHAALGWAFSHKATMEAYRRSTGEDIAPALDRYQAWVEENIVGVPEARKLSFRQQVGKVGDNRL